MEISKLREISRFLSAEKVELSFPSRDVISPWHWFLLRITFVELKIQRWWKFLLFRDAQSVLYLL